MSSELITLTIVSAALALYASWSLGRQRMASNFAVVRRQNEELKAEVAQLKDDRARDRQLIDILRAETDAARLRQIELEKQVAALENAMRLLGQEKTYWQRAAEEARMK